MLAHESINHHHNSGDLIAKLRRNQVTKLREGVQKIWRLNREVTKKPSYEVTRGGSKNLETQLRSYEVTKLRSYERGFKKSGDLIAKLRSNQVTKLREGVQKIWRLNREVTK